jgi:excisionase family DNA binding protein
VADKLLMTVDEAASMLGIARSHLYQLLQNAQVASVKIGRSRRIPVAALERFVQRRLDEDAPADE